MKEFLKRIFPRMFGKSELGPSQLSKALEVSMKKHRWILTTETYVPNAYKIRLNPESFRNLHPVIPSLQRQLVDEMNQLVMKEGYKLITPPIFVFLVEDEHLEGLFAIDPLPPLTQPEGASEKGRKDLIPPNKRSIKTSEKPVRSLDSRIKKDEDRRGEKDRSPRPTSDKLQKLKPEEFWKSKPKGSLEVLSGEGIKGKKFSLAGHKMILGRNPLADIRLPPEMSDIADRHAVIYYDNRRYYIEDANTPYGTYVNETLIKKVKLEPGAEIRIGRVVMRFVLES